MPFLGSSKGASPYFVMSSYEAAPQNEARNHEEGKNNVFWFFCLTGFSMIPKNSASSPSCLMSSQAPEPPKKREAPHF